MKPDELDADDFRGVENELCFCVGARVLLTQNLWVEAGLMNGALGVLRGYMWPQGGDPHSKDSELRSPICVFVEFDPVSLGVDANSFRAASSLMTRPRMYQARDGIGYRSGGRKFRLLWKKRCLGKIIL